MQAEFKAADMIYLFWASIFFFTYIFLGYPILLRVFRWEGHTAPQGISPGKRWKRNRHYRRMFRLFPARDDGEDYWKVDVAIALENMVLAAVEEGLGTCWIAAFNEEPAKKALNIPDGIRVVALTPLGYPDEEKGEVSDRKDMDEITHWNSW